MQNRIYPLVGIKYWHSADVSKGHNKLQWFINDVPVSECYDAQCSRSYWWSLSSTDTVFL